MVRRASSGTVRGLIGFALVASCWPLNWFLPGLRTAYLFFPLWLGYILVVDYLVERRTGTSLWRRSRLQFILLFALSALVWWLFELINLRTRNWEYIGSESFTQFEYHALCTICFTTVMPAIFETAELVRSLRGFDRFRNGPRLSATRRLFVVLLLTGLAMLGALLLWPRFFYPFAWTSLVLVLEPLNHWTRKPHFMERLKDGDWRTVIALSLGAIVCGFFWELWNYRSYPKWIYHTPGAEVLHVFEMPLLGYGGYVPFALELYALKNFVWPRGPRVQG